MRRDPVGEDRVRGHREDQALRVRRPETSKRYRPRSTRAIVPFASARSSSRRVMPPSRSWRRVRMVPGWMPVSLPPISRRRLRLFGFTDFDCDVLPRFSPWSPVD
ncbi:hypothetical protein CJ204_05910 [Corynebacterium xerosis]|uniref:Uncharacterized protein n=1 Tax=Corynebacterium xerosis TaxID=1725 RepID=A0A2N6SZ83_9CORY|nr:hypothetical protein CJ204_05910 [Corynebacterium xerosis]